MMRLLLVVSAITLMVACSPIQRHEAVQQPAERELVAGVGDVVLRIDQSRDLENIFGRADLYGRKTKEGFIEVRYLGFTRSGKAAFVRQDVAIHSNETTLTRQGGLIIPNTYQSTTTTTGMVGSVPVTGVSQTTGTAGVTVVPVPPAETIVLPPNSIFIEVDPINERSLVVGGRIIHIQSAQPGQLIYRVAAAGVTPSGEPSVRGRQTQSSLVQ